MRSKTRGVLLSFAFLPFILMIVIFFVFGSFGSSEHNLERDTSYEITKYNVEVDVNENGTYDIKETITANFVGDYKHGIVRWLQTKQQIKYYNKENKLVSKGRKAAISNFRLYDGTHLASTESVGNFKVYYFGKAGEYVHGEQVYTFSYNLDPGDDRDKTMDMFYFNIIGSGWDTTISNITFTITFPTEIEGNVDFYVGKYGEINVDSPRITDKNISGKTITGKCASLDFGEAITAFKSFKNGYFDYSSQRHIAIDIALIVSMAIFAGVALVLTITKRKKLPIVEVVEFKAPEGLTPTEVGYLNDGRITGDDLSALIVYWASKGFVRIVEKDKKLIVVKLKNLPETAKEHERYLFNALFRKGESFSPSNVSSDDIGEAGYKCKKSVEVGHADKFNTSNTKKYISVLTFLSVLVAVLFAKTIMQTYASSTMVIIAILLAGCTIAGLSLFDNIYSNKYKYGKKKFLLCIICDLIAIFAPLIVFAVVFDHYYDLLGARFIIMLLPFVVILLATKIEVYTDKGKEILGHIRGLKTYIETAEKDKLEMLVKDDPTIFYEILPYAYVLGVSDVYMSKFKDIPIISPDYYQTDNGTFGYVHFVVLRDSLNGFSVRARESMIKGSPAAKALSSASGGHGGGFSGGGFSGGGSGGGVGGSW